MEIRIDPRVFEIAPGFVRYVLLVDGMKNMEDDQELLAQMRQEESRVRESAEFEDLKAHPRLASWRDIFGAFGVNPNKCPPSVANLIKRVRGGKDLPFVNSLVCIFNICSLRYVMPAGGDDLDTVKGDIFLTVAKGTEHYIPLGKAGAADAVESPESGEIILLDTGSDTVLCRAWCWKNGDTTKIGSDSARVAINLDILPPLTAEEGASAAEFVADLIRKYCGGNVNINRLDNSCHSLLV